MVLRLNKLKIEYYYFKVFSFSIYLKVCSIILLIITPISMLYIIFLCTEMSIKDFLMIRKYRRDSKYKSE